MDVAEQGRLGKVQQVIVALNFPFVILESIAPECGLIQFLVLDHGAHATIKNDNPLLEGLVQLFQACIAIGHRKLFRVSLLTSCFTFWRGIIAKMLKGVLVRMIIIKFRFACPPLG